MKGFLVDVHVGEGSLDDIEDVADDGIEIWHGMI